MGKEQKVLTRQRLKCYKVQRPNYLVILKKMKAGIGDRNKLAHNCKLVAKE